MKVYMSNEDYRVISIDKSQDIIHEIETDPKQIEYVCSKDDFICMVADFMATESDKESKLEEMRQYIHDDAVNTFEEMWTEVEVEE